MPTRSPEEFLIDQPAAADAEDADGVEYAGLRQGLGRLDDALELDENWRALAQLDEREARGEPLEAVAGEKLRGLLQERLNQSRTYRARLKIAEALAILDGSQELAPVVPDAAEPASHPEVEDDQASTSAGADAPVAKEDSNEIEATPFGNLSKIDPTDAQIETLTSWRYQSERAAPAEPADIGTTEQPSKEVTALAGAAGAFTVIATASIAANSAVSTLPDEKPDNDNKTEETGSADPSAASTGKSGEETQNTGHAIEDDRLELIRGIDDELAQRMRGEDGIGLEQISRWTIEDVVAVSRKYDLGLTVASQGWIEQAALLVGGRYSSYAVRLITHDFDALVERPPPAPPQKNVIPAGPAPEPAQRPETTQITLPAEDEDTAISSSGSQDQTATDDNTVDKPPILKSVDAANVLTGFTTMGVAAAVIGHATADKKTDPKTTETQSSDTKSDETIIAPEDSPEKNAADAIAADPQQVPTAIDPAKEVQPKTEQSIKPVDYTGDFLSRHSVKPDHIAVRAPGSPEPSSDTLSSAGSEAADSSSAFAAPRRTGSDEQSGGGVFEAGKPDAEARPSLRKPAIAQSRIPDTYEPGKFEEEAEVVIVARKPDDENLAADQGEEEKKPPRPALGRINKDREERESGIEAHAAYRMETDEASVVIVHRDKGDNAPDLPFYKQNEQYEREGTIRKFLKALTGD